MHNIFIVKSPLQLINAIEAKEHFQTTHNILVLMNANPTNDKQMQTVLALSQWDDIITYTPKNKKSTLFAQIKLIKRLKNHHYHRLFSGDFGTFNQVIISNLNADELFMIDDGTMSIEIHKRLYHPSKPKFSKQLKLLRYKLFGLSTTVQQTINFFTCYNLAQIDNEQIVPNDYEYLQSVFQPKNQDDNIYLLGQNIDNKWMKLGKYIEYLQHLKSFYAGKIIYMPHRHEIISDALKALFDDRFVLQHNDIPIEIYFLEKEIYPTHIVSFTSSALFTLNKIYNRAKIDAIYIHQEDLMTMHDFVSSCYTFYEPLNIHVVDLFKETK